LSADVRERSTAMFRKKSAWERATSRVPSGDGAKSAAKSGVAAMVGAVALTAASAVVSSLRKRDEK
jgi:hypothetical protein